jgi:hypothetical protein
MNKGMELFELFTVVGGIMIGMGITLFALAATLAYFIGEINESES